MTLGVECILYLFAFLLTLWSAVPESRCPLWIPVVFLEIALVTHCLR